MGFGSLGVGRLDSEDGMKKIRDNCENEEKATLGRTGCGVWVR